MGFIKELRRCGALLFISSSQPSLTLNHQDVKNDGSLNKWYKRCCGFLNKQTWDYCVDTWSVKWWRWPLVFRPGQVRSEIWEANIEPLGIWRREAAAAKLDSNLDFLPSQIDFRPNDARLVLQTHAWQMHTTGRWNLRLQNYNTKTWSSRNNEMRMYSDTKLKRYLITLMLQNISEGSYCCLSISFYCSMNVTVSKAKFWRIQTFIDQEAKTCIKILLLKRDTWTINFPEQSV